MPGRDRLALAAVPERRQPRVPPEQRPDSDLRAQIEARIATRRTAAEAAGRHHSVTPMPASESVPTDPESGAGDLRVPAGSDPVTTDSTSSDSEPVPAGSGSSESEPVPAGSGSPGPEPVPAGSPSAAKASPSGAPSGIGRVLRSLSFLLAVALAVIGLRSFVLASYYIPSASMETTLHGCKHCQPDMVLVDKLSYRFGHVSRADVVVFDRPPLAPPEDKELIKRVIGLPGETVSGHDGKVYIGNKPLDEPYLNPACNGTGDFAAVTVPAGQYFMMGDNRCNSLDSRVFGTIARSSIVGRSFSVIWPVKHLRWL